MISKCLGLFLVLDTNFVLGSRAIFGVKDVAQFCCRVCPISACLLARTEGRSPSVPDKRQLAAQRERALGQDWQIQPSLPWRQQGRTVTVTAEVENVKTRIVLRTSVT